MSIRYGIDLVLQPSFTARVYQTRQIVCGQYSSWAAEMQMMRMALTPYFACPDDRPDLLASQVEKISRASQSDDSAVLTPVGIVADPEINGVVMEFDAPQSLYDLRRTVMEAAHSHDSRLNLMPQFHPRIALLEYGVFPKDILPDAVEFARGVAADLGVGNEAYPWRLLLTRYESEAAGDDWSNGRWAADLSWQQLHSHPLYTEGT
jgi:hypothetical protein